MYFVKREYKLIAYWSYMHAVGWYLLTPNPTTNIVQGISREIFLFKGILGQSTYGLRVYLQFTLLLSHN